MLQCIHYIVYKKLNNQAKPQKNKQWQSFSDRVAADNGYIQCQFFFVYLI